MGCISSKLNNKTKYDANSVSAQDGRTEAVSNIDAYSRVSPHTHGSITDGGRDPWQGGEKSTPTCSQSDYLGTSSIACELGTNVEARSEASSTCSSSVGATTAAERDDISATDHWSMLNDELAARSIHPGEELAHVDSPTYSPTEFSRDDAWATRSTGTVGDAIDRHHWSTDVLHLDEQTNGVAYDSASSSLAPSETKDARR